MSTTTDNRDARHVPLSRADKLGQDAAEAARVRSLANNPDVIALRVERVRTQVDVLMWVGIVLGLGFTMVNVQHFAAAGAVAGTLPWLAAWLLDPMVSLVLVAVLRAEQITARYQVEAGLWAGRTKWFAFTATLVMNTWQSWAALNLSGIVLHSVPPVLVLCAAETAPWLRDRLTEATHAAARLATEQQPANTTGPVAEAAANSAGESAVAESPNTPNTETEPAANTAATVPAEAAPARSRTATTTAAEGGKPARKLYADYLADARAAFVPSIEPTPAWVRSVTECGRATSKKVADALQADHATREASPTPLPTVIPVPAESKQEAA